MISFTGISSELFSGLYPKENIHYSVDHEELKIFESNAKKTKIVKTVNGCNKVCRMLCSIIIYPYDLTSRACAIKGIQCAVNAMEMIKHSSIDTIDPAVTKTRVDKAENLMRWAIKHVEAARVHATNFSFSVNK